MNLFSSSKFPANKSSLNNISLGKSFIWTFFCTGLLLFVACSTDNEEELFAERNGILASQGCDADNTALSFTDCIAPIIQQNCEGCHNAGFASGGVALTNYDEIKVYVDNGRIPIVIDPEDISELMPPTGKMPDLNITLIKNWIDQGAPNN